MVSDRMTKTGSGPKAEDATIPRIVADALIHRGELASLELEEARAHGAVTTLTAVFSGILLLLGGVAGILAVAVAIWESQRSWEHPVLHCLGLRWRRSPVGCAGDPKAAGLDGHFPARAAPDRDCACMQDVTGEEAHLIPSRQSFSIADRPRADSCSNASLTALKLRTAFRKASIDRVSLSAADLLVKWLPHLPGRGRANGPRKSSRDSSSSGGSTTPASPEGPQTRLPRNNNKTPPITMLMLDPHLLCLCNRCRRARIHRA